jgi:hypothetical protein
MKATTILAFLFLICAALPLYAADINDLTYDASGATVTITDCDTAASGALVIPETIEGKPVTSIGYDAFYDCSSLASIAVSEGNMAYSSEDGVLFNKAKTILIVCPGGKSGAYAIPESVTSIGDYAFSDCTSLASVTIPGSVTSTGYEAFWGCTSLTSITIPDGVTSIGQGAFATCTNLTSITIPSSVTSIGDYAFSDCTSLTSIAVSEGNIAYSSEDGVLFNKAKTILIVCPGGNSGAYEIPESVTSIGDYAFDYCTSLPSITIPGSVTSIGDYAFSDCSSLASVTIPGSVTSIGYSAFYGCRSLASVTVPDSVTSIGSSVFRGCSSLANITLPNSITSIGYSAFYGCRSLASVTVPDSVTSIGSSAFRGCSSLANITLPNSVTSIGNYAFRDCSSLTSITFGANSLNNLTELYRATERTEEAKKLERRAERIRAMKR